MGHKEEWWKKMILKHGSEEAVREFMAKSATQVKSRGKGGFYYLKQNDPDKLKHISQKGGKTRSKDTNEINPMENVL